MCIVWGRGVGNGPANTVMHCHVERVKVGYTQWGSLCHFWRDGCLFQLSGTVITVPNELW